MAQIFVSHSQHDDDIKMWFSALFGRTNVKAFFVEYERYQPPAWPFIQQQILNSSAVFVLLGPNVEKLTHTKVWIGSETGAAPLGKEVWVFEPIKRQVNVPIPNVQHYMLYDFPRTYEDYIRAIIESYDDSPTLPSALVGGGIGGALGGPLGALIGAGLLVSANNPARNRPLGVIVQCRNEQCQATFHLHTRVDKFPCPVCRSSISVSWS